MSQLMTNDAYWGSEELKQVMELQKALTAGYGTSPATMTGGGATRLESLQSTLKICTHQEKAAAMWQRIGKKKAWSTIEEYTKLSEVGDADFYVEGGLPEEQEGTLSREFEKVKFCGAVGKVSKVLQSVRTMMDPRALQVRIKTLAIIRRLDWALFFANEDYVPTQFNGLFKAVLSGASDNIIDMEGKRPSLEKIAEGAQIIADNYGIPNVLFLSNAAKKQYADYLVANKYYVLGESGKTGMFGVNPKEFRTPHGDGDVINDVFLRNSGGVSPSVAAPSNATSIKAPATPAATAAATADPNSKLAAGTYDYKVTAINEFGESAAVDVADVVIASGEKAVITIVEGGGAHPATGYKIYRAADGGTPHYCFTVAASAGEAQDLDYYRPDTTMGFLIDFDFDQVLSYHQLLPFFLMPLAVIDDADRWLQKIYGALVTYNPKKVVVLKNIGPIAWS